MLELLVGLIIATVLVIGWVYGSLFACVFLTLCGVVLGALGAAVTQDGSGFLAGGIIILLAWLPRVLRKTTAY